MSDAISKAIDVLVPRAAVTEVLRISDRQHPAWDAVKAALLSAAKGEPVAVVEKGVLNWIDGKQFDRDADLYTHPQPAVPEGWQRVMRGMVEYAECNDPNNPYLTQAQALLSAGKGE